MIEMLGILVKIATGYLVLRTLEGNKQVPYKALNVLYDPIPSGLEELRNKKIKAIIWEDGTIEIRSPNE